MLSTTYTEIWTYQQTGLNFFQVLFQPLRLFIQSEDHFHFQKLAILTKFRHVSEAEGCKTKEWHWDSGINNSFFLFVVCCFFFRNCPIQGLFTVDLIWMIITKEIINKTWAFSIQTKRAFVCLGSTANNYFNALLFKQFGDRIQKFSLHLFGEQFLYGNSVSPYCFPLPTVLLYIVFMMMIFIISYSISLYSGKKHHLTFILCS